MRSPQGGLSTGNGTLKVVMLPCQGSDPASGHPRAQLLPFGTVPTAGVGSPPRRLWPIARVVALLCVDPDKEQ